MLNTRTALLQALITGHGYGLELAERVRERSRGKIDLGQGTLYPALRALERQGLVRSWEADPTPERGGRPRVYYELTAKGAKAAQDERQAIGSLIGWQELGA
jgi:PadR family transcriptional regulator, regulatory protein PadR